MNVAFDYIRIEIYARCQLQGTCTVMSLAPSKFAACEGGPRRRRYSAACKSAERTWESAELLEDLFAAHILRLGRLLRGSPPGEPSEAMNIGYDQGYCT